MCMSLDRRLQLLLDQDRYERVAAAARRQRVSVATVIRDAIDVGVPSEDRDRASAAAFILAAQPMPVPAVDDLLEELDRTRGRA